MLSSDFRGVSRDAAGEAVMGDVEHCDKKEAVGFVSLLGLSSLELVSFAVCSNTSWGKKRLRRRRLFVSSASQVGTSSEFKARLRFDFRLLLLSRSIRRFPLTPVS
jgi:hypothetical protein